MISFFVEGKPVPKGRPRVVRGHTFTPRRTAEWEATVGWTARSRCGLSEPLTGPVKVILQFHGARANADIDNLSKAVLDGLNGICFVDDKQVHELGAWRATSYDHRPGVQVSIEPLPVLRAVR